MTESHDTYDVTIEPVTEIMELLDFKQRLRVLSTDFDCELEDLLKQGRVELENRTARRYVSQTVALYKDGFPPGDTIEIREAPIQSVTSVQYYDEDVALQTLSASAYVADLTGEPPRIILLENQQWEDTEPNYPRSVIVTYVAGYGDQYDVPVAARLAVAEWGRMHWGKCDGDASKYENLVNTLCWTGLGRAA
jgi:uncharacterized phiE125 gp8 family phage protein